ncbi:hypothetical protein GV794_20870 [Nocardia cyriacigeorgica]|uniref:Uncharacterized protein n=1 Tax=Nocardia cyriacigeorgica TaxID=135487 RepID=A0A6P1D8A5_9NOCA|nr:hypothetical protein [Nocardia cyriacigeorgica]NEW38860.1 hypothetical protein [Nocardia cyriacigeorgica]NEW46318.1 hypothetical protein [Nocardia cyriacigeorgica]NEW50413.1 hypothetical protein [Nocardia cyriacigeorgica]NEW58086.1 hypothetical protein [Nocardia cyriacigeorgica]
MASYLDLIANPAASEVAGFMLGQLRDVANDLIAGFGSSTPDWGLGSSTGDHSTGSSTGDWFTGSATP